MKNIITAIFITLLTITFTSCENQKTAKSIIGHTFGVIESSTSYMTIYFSKSGNATVDFRSKDQSFMTSHFTYDIQGDDVEIYYDYSNYWIETAKGRSLGHDCDPLQRNKIKEKETTAKEVGHPPQLVIIITIVTNKCKVFR